MNVLCDICKDSDHACIKALRKEVERLEGIIKTASAYLEHIEGPRCRVPAGTWSVATRISAARVALDSAYPTGQGMTHETGKVASRGR